MMFVQIFAWATNTPPRKSEARKPLELRHRILHAMIHLDILLWSLKSSRDRFGIFLAQKRRYTSGIWY